MMMDFAGRLKRLRIEKGYSQATLAKKSPMQAKSRAKHPSPNSRAGAPIPICTPPPAWRIASGFQSIILPVARKPRSFRLTV